MTMSTNQNIALAVLVFDFVIFYLVMNINTITWMEFGSMAKKDWTGNRYCLLEVLSRICINYSIISKQISHKWGKNTNRVASR